MSKEDKIITDFLFKRIHELKEEMKKYDVRKSNDVGSYNELSWCIGTL